MSVDLSQPNLPFKSPDEFILNSEYHNLVSTIKLPRPGNFVEQTISICKAFCGRLLSHEIIKSDLIRGLACVDSGVKLHGSEDQYVAAVECLTGHFVQIGWLNLSEKTKSVSQYRSIVSKFRTVNMRQVEDWFQFLVSHYELQCRPELHKLFKLSSLCLPPLVQIPAALVTPIPELGTDEESFRSCIGAIQLSYSTVPKVSSLYQDPRTISRVFRLLGRGKEILEDRELSTWNFLRGNGAKRSTLCTKFESAYKRSVVAPDNKKLPDDGDITCGSGSTTSNSSPSPRSVLGKATLSL